MTTIVEAIRNLLLSNKWYKVKVRNQEWYETIGVKMCFEIDVDDLNIYFPHMDLYMAKARSEYLMKTHEDGIGEVIETLKQNIYTRQAVISGFDWWWYDHLWCVWGIQFLVRENKLHSLIYLRSSNLWRALPYDLHALLSVRKIILRELKLSKLSLGSVYYFAGSAHVAVEDWSKFLWHFGVKESEVEIHEDLGR